VSGQVLVPALGLLGQPIDDAGLSFRFQQVVQKGADVRVAVVGRKEFATRIDIDGDHLDWRLHYDRGRHVHRPPRRSDPPVGCR
jgi:hypothetical protein